MDEAEYDHFYRVTRPFLGSIGLIPTAEEDRGPLRGTDRIAPWGEEIWEKSSEYHPDETRNRQFLLNPADPDHAE